MKKTRIESSDSKDVGSRAQEEGQRRVFAVLRDTRTGNCTVGDVCSEK